MTNFHSDALVFFGATGDLAYKKIFPALQAMIRRGHLDMPVIGVAKAGWTLDQLKSGPATASKNTAASMNRPSTNCAICCATSTATTRTPPPFKRCAKNSAPPSIRRITWPFRPCCSPLVVEQLGKSELRQGRPRHRRKALRPRPGLGARRSIATLHRALSTNRRSFASTIISAKSRCRTCSTSASPTPSWSRSGIATTSRASRSPWPKISASQGRGAFYEEAGAIRDVVQNHLLQVLANLAMEPPAATDSESIRDEKVKGPQGDSRRSVQIGRARPVPRLSQGEGRGGRFAGRNLRRLQLQIHSWRWQGVPFFIRAGKCLPVTCTEVDGQVSPAARRSSPRRRRRPNYLRFRVSPERDDRPGHAWSRSRASR